MVHDQSNATMESTPSTPRRGHFLRNITLVSLTVVMAYLLAWPVPIDPVAFELPSATPFSQAALVIDKAGLGGMGKGPEAIQFDKEGRLYAGLDNGTIIRSKRSMQTWPPVFESFAETLGRPIGFRITADGTLFVADAKLGLLRITADGKVETIFDTYEGKKILFADDLDISSSGDIYISDVSTKFGYGEDIEDVMENRPLGRLFKVNPTTKAATVVLPDLCFANGVAFGPGEEFLLVNETSRCRVRRLWLKGPNAGKNDMFLEGLPGFPDNVTFNGKDTFYIALASPRTATLEVMGPRPWLRKIAFRLPKWARPIPFPEMQFLAVSVDGKTRKGLLVPQPQGIPFTTSVIEHDGFLYFGGLRADVIGRSSLADFHRCFK